jgi:hypothetical protein
VNWVLRPEVTAPIQAGGFDTVNKTLYRLGEGCPKALRITVAIGATAVALDVHIDSMPGIVVSWFGLFDSRDGFYYCAWRPVRISDVDEDVIAPRALVDDV